MTATERPILKLTLTKTDKCIEFIGLLLVLGFWLYTVFHYKSLPEIIPTHFSGGGKVDGYGSKLTIISLPIVGSLLYLSLTILSKYPHKFNYTVAISEANAMKQYSIITRMLRVMKVMLVIVFFLIDYQTTQIALGMPNNFGKWFLLLDFTLIFAPIFYFLIQSSKNS
jgi:uncharacterized membrane protein